MSASHIDFYYETSLWRLGVVGEEEGGGGGGGVGVITFLNANSVVSIDN